MNAVFRRQGYVFIRFWAYWIPIVQKAFSFMALYVVIEFFLCPSSPEHLIVQLLTTVRIVNIRKSRFQFSPVSMFLKHFLENYWKMLISGEVEILFVLFSLFSKGC